MFFQIIFRKIENLIDGSFYKVHWVCSEVTRSFSEVSGNMFDFEKITSDISFLRKDHVLLNEKPEFTQTREHIEQFISKKKHSKLK